MRMLIEGLCRSVSRLQLRMSKSSSVVLHRWFLLSRRLLNLWALTRRELLASLRTKSLLFRVLGSVMLDRRRRSDVPSDGSMARRGSPGYECLREHRRLHGMDLYVWQMRRERSVYDARNEIVQPAIQFTYSAVKGSMLGPNEICTRICR